MIIDTHLHLIDLSTLRYPWLSGVPALNRDFTQEDYATQARRVGIEAALHMEVDVHPADIEAETAHVKTLAARPASLLRGAIVSGRPEADGFAAYLERLKDDPLVKGVRRVLHVAPDELSRSALFRDNIRRMAGTGLTFDLCVLPRQHDGAMALIDVAPEVQFVLDHCGNPDIKGGGAQPWRAQIAEIARRPNVVAKISGVLAHVDPASWSVETLRPYVEHVIACFGWERVVWGSDWPVCTQGGSLATWVAATHALLSGTSLDERTKLLSGNARRIWRL